MISTTVLDKIKIKTALHNSDAKLTSFSGHSIKAVGTIQLPCKFKDEIHDIDFQVVKGTAQTILGSQA